MAKVTYVYFKLHGIYRKALRRKYKFLINLLSGYVTILMYVLPVDFCAFIGV